MGCLIGPYLIFSIVKQTLESNNAAKLAIFVYFVSNICNFTYVIHLYLLAVGAIWWVTFNFCVQVISTLPSLFMQLFWKCEEAKAWILCEIMIFHIKYFKIYQGPLENLFLFQCLSSTYFPHMEELQMLSAIFTTKCIERLCSAQNHLCWKWTFPCIYLHFCFWLK